MSARALRRKPAKPCSPALAAMLTALAGLMLPLAGALMWELFPQNLPLCMAVPPVVLTVIVCLACPRWPLPPLVVAGMAGVSQLWRLHPNPPASFAPFQALQGARPEVLLIALAAVACGYASVALRKQSSLRPRTWRTNLHLLFRRPGVFVRAYRWPLAALMLGAAMDAATTIAFMLAYGIEMEVHAAMRIMAEVCGIIPGVLIGTGIRLGFVLFAAATWRRWCAWMLWLCAALYAAAAVWNAGIYFSLRGYFN